TGNAPFAWILGRRYEELHGIDLSSEAADIARAKGYKMQVGLIEECIQDLGPASFDLVFSRHVLEHVSDPDGVVEACYALTTPGGWNLHAVPMPPYTDPVHITEFWPHEWARLFQRVGFTVYESRRVSVLGHEEIQIKAQRPD
ncbi:MAG: class I SAM-dependent methyltransferase, partial [Candidatus Thermoplasmatota archaeon]|nr:class I SAM-dependent methyltransferase [Candidatus Thermoplasmatota archaeon]